MPAISAEELLIRASQNGFVTSAHKEEDAKRNVGPISDNVKRNRTNTLRRYVAYHLNCMRERTIGSTQPTEADARAECLQEGIDPPSVTYMKDFFRFYVATSTPRRKNKHKTTRDPHEEDKTNDQSMKTVGKWFFGGFAEATGTYVPEADRTEIQSWIKHVLPHEGIIGREKRTKYNLFVKEIKRMLVSLFTKNDLTWIADREL